jgi:hypothetical protein
MREMAIPFVDKLSYWHACHLLDDGTVTGEWLAAASVL